MKTLILFGLLAIFGCVNLVAGILATPTSVTLADVQFQAASSLETQTTEQIRIQEILAAMSLAKETSKILWLVQKADCGDPISGDIARKDKGSGQQPKIEWRIMYDSNTDCLIILDVKSGEQFADSGCTGTVSHANVSERAFSESFFGNNKTVFEANREHWQRRFKTVLADIVRALKP